MSDTTDRAWSCTVMVDHVEPLDEGACVHFVTAGGGGIDIDPGTFAMNVTAEVAEALTGGEAATLTLHTEP